MSTFRSIMGEGSWLASVNRKVFQLSPVNMLLVTLFTLIGQVANTLALLLPLKVILIMGSGATPSYFPAFFQSWGLQQLVVSLCLLAMGFYVLGSVSASLVTALSKRGALIAAQRRAKLVVIGNQDERTRSIYRLITALQADTVFVLLGFVGLWLLYPGLSLFLLAACVVFAATGWISAKYRNAWPAQTMAIGPNLLFLGAFIFMVVDYLYGAQFARYAALVSVILSRQVLNRFFRIISNVREAFIQRSLIDVLLFHGKALIAPRGHGKDGFWNRFGGNEGLQSISEAVEAATGIAVDMRQAHPVKPGRAATLDYMFTEPGTSRQLYVKLFDQKGELNWQNECEFLSLHDHRGGAVPHLVGQLQLDAGYLSVMAALRDGGDEGGNRIAASGRKPDRRSMWIALWSVKPDAKAQEKYRRSHLLAYEKLDDAFLERLGPVARLWGAEAHFDGFVRHNERIRAHLAKLPLVIVNPIFPAGLRELNGSIVGTDWCGWSMDVVGSGWQWHASGKKEAESILQALIANRNDMGDAGVTDLELAALVHDLVRSLNAKRWHHSVELLPAINRILGEKG